MAHQTVTKCWGQGCPRSHWQTWTRQADVQGFPGGHSSGGWRKRGLLSVDDLDEKHVHRGKVNTDWRRKQDTLQRTFIYMVYILFLSKVQMQYLHQDNCLFVFPVLDFSVMFENTKTTNQEQGCANELTNPTSLLRATIESQCWTKMTTCSPKLPSVVLPYCRRG